MPIESSAESALNWISNGLLGAIGTAVAILAVAGLGLAMMQGRIPARRGAIVVIGCFILFSSRSITTALISISTPRIAEVTVPLAAPPAYTAPIARPVPYDPYAGASVPVRSQDSARNLLPQ
jgi:type IV secretory pathway VirB2 component (pilin)